MTPGVRTNEVVTATTTTTQPPLSPKSADMVSLSEVAAAELEQLAEDCCCSVDHRQPFPRACRALVQELDGNKLCIDCGRKNPEWAALSYGALVCLYCSGTHRSLGVTVSTVRSITMDHWNYFEVVKMLEGGNRQLSSFFQRHSLTSDAIDNCRQQLQQSSSTTNNTNTNTTTNTTNPATSSPSVQLNSENISTMRYKTKAALFYRKHLDHHVQNLLAQGVYKGRRQRKRRPLGTQASNLEC